MLTIEEQLMQGANSVRIIANPLDLENWEEHIESTMEFLYYVQFPIYLLVFFKIFQAFDNFYLSRIVEVATLIFSYYAYQDLCAWIKNYKIKLGKNGFAYHFTKDHITYTTPNSTKKFKWRLNYNEFLRIKPSICNPNIKNSLINIHFALTKGKFVLTDIDPKHQMYEFLKKKMNPENLKRSAPAPDAAINNSWDENV